MATYDNLPFKLIIFNRPFIFCDGKWAVAFWISQDLSSLLPESLSSFRPDYGVAELSKFKI